MTFDKYPNDKFLRVVRDQNNIWIQTVRRKSLCYTVADAKKLRDELTRSIERAESIDAAPIEPEIPERVVDQWVVEE